MPSSNWFFILFLLGASSSLVNLCTLPLVGFAAIAAETLTWRQGVMSLTLIWAVNQALGFGFRGYPLDTSTVAWGLVMLAGALAALALGRAIHRSGIRSPLARPANLGIRLTTALVVGFLTYQLILWLASFALGTAGGFTPAVLGSVLLTNGLWALALTVLFRLGERSWWLSQPRRRSIPSARL